MVVYDQNRLIGKNNCIGTQMLLGPVVQLFGTVDRNKFNILPSPKCQNYSCEERGEIGNIANKLINEIQIWEGIEIRPHTFGGFQFKMNGMDIGHIHGDKIVDLPLSSHIQLKISLLKEKNNNNIKLSNYHIYPGSKWIVYYLKDDSDISTVLRDFKFQYDHIRAH